MHIYLENKAKIKNKKMRVYNLRLIVKRREFTKKKKTDN